MYKRQVVDFSRLRAAALTSCPFLMILFLFLTPGSSSESDRVTERSARDSSSRSSQSPALSLGSSSRDLPRPPVSRAHSLAASRSSLFVNTPRKFNREKKKSYGDSGYVQGRSMIEILWIQDPGGDSTVSRGRLRRLGPPSSRPRAHNPFKSSKNSKIPRIFTDSQAMFQV